MRALSACLRACSGACSGACSPALCLARVGCLICVRCLRVSARVEAYRPSSLTGPISRRPCSSRGAILQGMVNTQEGGTDEGSVPAVIMSCVRVSRHPRRVLARSLECKIACTGYESTLPRVEKSSPASQETSRGCSEGLGLLRALPEALGAAVRRGIRGAYLAPSDTEGPSPLACKPRPKREPIGRA